jgi:Rrf2 family protein
MPLRIEFKRHGEPGRFSWRMEMKLSTKGRYGVRLMMDLAEHYTQGAISLKDISSRQEISEKYLWQLINPLKNAALISSTRGSQGGYTLSKLPSLITLKDILLVVEGPLSLVECTQKPALCHRSNHCAARDIWSQIADKLSETLGAFTLEHMIEKQDRMKQVISYNI